MSLTVTRESLDCLKIEWDTNHVLLSSEQVQALERWECLQDCYGWTIGPADKSGFFIMSRQKEGRGGFRVRFQVSELKNDPPELALKISSFIYQKFDRLEEAFRVPLVTN